MAPPLSGVWGVGMLTLLQQAATAPVPDGSLLSRPGVQWLLAPNYAHVAPAPSRTEESGPPGGTLLLRMHERERHHCLHPLWPPLPLRALRGAPGREARAVPDLPATSDRRPSRILLKIQLGGAGRAGKRPRALYFTDVVSVGAPRHLEETDGQKPST